MNWVRERPIAPGTYLFQNIGQWPILVGMIKWGDWRQAQNPDALYCNGAVLSGFEAIWCGPIPDPS